MPDAPTVATGQTAPTAPPSASPMAPPEPSSLTPPPTSGDSTSIPSTGDTSPKDPVVPDAPPSDDPKPDPFKAFAQDKADAPAPPADAPAADAPADGDPLADPPSWKEALPLSMREDSYVNRFESMDEFLKGVKNLQQLASRKGLERPSEDAPPEAWNEYWETVGRPTNPEDYVIENLKDSTGADVFEFDQETVGELRKEFHKKGLTNDQAEFMMSKYAEIQMAQDQQKALAHQKRTDETLTVMQQEYKETADSNIRRALNALEGVGLYDLLADAGMETDIRAIQVGMKLSSEFSEAVVGQKNSVKGAETRLTEIESSKAFNSARDPNHKAAVEERNRLLKEIHGG